MNNFPHFKVVGYDDWHGLYVDDVLFTQGHTVTIYELTLAAKDGPFTLSEEGDEALGDWLLANGRLPDNYNSIPREALA